MSPFAAAVLVMLDLCVFLILLTVHAGINILIADFVDLLDGKLVDCIIKLNKPS